MIKKRPRQPNFRASIYSSGAGLSRAITENIEPLIERGVPGFKAFLTHSGIDEFPNVTEKDLRLAMPILARHNLPLLVHCELTSLLAETTNDKVRYQGLSASRPKTWEDEAIALMIRLCEEYNCRVHIVHLSSANSIAPITAAKARGLPVTVETAQHYLYFNAEDIQDGQTILNVRHLYAKKHNNDLLWQALKDGIIDFVATDHSPAPPGLKELQSGDFTKAWGGISSLQFALPVLWTAAQKRGCDLNDITTWLSQKPAMLPGLEKRKGKIEKGYDADLIILDPERSFKVVPEIIQHKHKITPYLGHTLSGVVEQTYVGGKLLYDNEIFTTKK